MSKKKQNKRVIFYEFILRLIKWLANNLTKSSYKERSYAIWVVTKIFNVLETRGKAECIRYTKELRLKFLKSILSIDSETFKRRDQSRLPKILNPIVRHIEKSKSYPFIRLIFSSLYISRSIRLDSEISFETIESGPSYKKIPSSLDPEIKLFLKDLGIRTKQLGKVPKSLRFKEFHMSSKSGPNGHALWTSYVDAMALSESQRLAIKLLAGDKLDGLITKFVSLYHQIPRFFDNFNPRKGIRVTRRISKINDKEGKTREVAIGDYYTQAALLPLHNYLMKTLSRIPQDCTTNQTKLFKTLERSEGSSYHSIDLTAFTDRFPIDLNHRIKHIWFGPEYADAWRSLMIDTPFHYKDKLVYYRTGNPMGLYSSWASTTLAHHFLLWLACKRARLRWGKCRYMLLGDDIVIATDTVAEHYKDILAEWGVEFNVSKTHTSENGFEFAKQIRLHDQNVSPFPLAALFERRTESITTLGILLSEILQKEWNLELLSVVKSYWIDVKQWPRPRFRAYRPIIYLVISFLRYLQGGDDLGKAINVYVNRSILYKAKKKNPGLKLKWSKSSHKRLFIHWLAVQVVQKLYIDSRERIISPNTPGTLGDLSTFMVMEITSLRDGGADCFDLIEAVPFLQVYGRAEEVFLQSYDNLYDYGMGSQGIDLRNLIGKVDIPLSDQGFYTRHRDVLIVQAMRASKILTDTLKTTTEVVAYNGQLRFPVPWAPYLSKAPKT